MTPATARGSGVMRTLAAAYREQRSRRNTQRHKGRSRMVDFVGGALDGTRLRVPDGAMWASYVDLYVRADPRGRTFRLAPAWRVWMHAALARIGFML